MSTSTSRNFTCMEDVWIARSYKTLTTDPACWPSHDSDVFYQKLAEAFNNSIRSTGHYVQFRSAPSIKGRWLNQLQKALLAFSRCMAKALDELPRGTMSDYRMLACRYFRAETGKDFKWEMPWEIVNDLPKFEPVTKVMSNGRKRALLYSISDARLVEAQRELQPPPPSNHGPSNSRQLGEPTPLCDPRPPTAAPVSTPPRSALRSTASPRLSISKKKAKPLNFGNVSAFEAATLKMALKKQEILERMVASSEEETRIMRNNYNFKLFAMDPNSVEAKEFWSLKAKEEVLRARLENEKLKRELDELVGEVGGEREGSVTASGGGGDGPCW
ncbi:hypothetical protein HDU96_004189 [Phlyctochytrium bullatum]|nr:hypothetical protein HDU96_004189 [Phlyctochytrium bullatum]